MSVYLHMSVHPHTSLFTHTPPSQYTQYICSPIHPYTSIHLCPHTSIHSHISVFPPYICISCITVGQSYSLSASLLVTCSVLYYFSNSTQCPYIHIYPFMYKLFQQNLEKVPKIWEGISYLFTVAYKKSVLLPYKLFMGLFLWKYTPYISYWCSYPFTI